MRKKSSFPLEVTIRRGEDGSYLFVAEDDELFRDGEIVGVYELKDVRRVKVTQTLEQE